MRFHIADPTILYGLSEVERALEAGVILLKPRHDLNLHVPDAAHIQEVAEERVRDLGTRQTAVQQRLFDNEAERTVRPLGQEALTFGRAVTCCSNCSSDRVTSTCPCPTTRAGTSCGSR
jgi:hypothetical protein